MLYEDGDGEDLNTDECAMTVGYRDKIESGEIKEWELGQELLIIYLSTHLTLIHDSIYPGDTFILFFMSSVSHNVHLNFCIKRFVYHV